MTEPDPDESMVFRPEFAARLNLTHVRSLAQVKGLPKRDGSALVDGHWRSYWLEGTVAAFVVVYAARGGKAWRLGQLGGWARR